MKNIILTSILILTLCFTTKASMDCIWTSSKSGLTIKYVASWDIKHQSLLDSIVNDVVDLLNRQDTSLKILVLINTEGLSFPNSEYSNFFSIGYDTLREVDKDYIFNYYWNQEHISTSQNDGLNKFNSRIAPLDINYTNINTVNESGIKIIYNRDYRSGEPIWEDITKAIVYGAYNVGVLKIQQVRETVRYNANGWYVSLVTLDTFSINRILGKVQAINTIQTKPVATIRTAYIFIGVVALLIILGLLLVRTKFRL